MTAQRTDRQVARDAQRFNSRIGELRAFLRRNGIRNPHTSQKAQAAIRRAAVRVTT